MIPKRHSATLAALTPKQVQVLRKAILELIYVAWGGIGPMHDAKEITDLLHEYGLSDGGVDRKIDTKFWTTEEIDAFKAPTRFQVRCLLREALTLGLVDHIKARERLNASHYHYERNGRLYAYYRGAGWK